MKTKTITIKKRGGGTRKQKVQVLASGKFKFIKNTGSKVKRKAKSVKRRVKSKVKRVNRKKTSRSTMKKKTSSRKSGFKIPILSSPLFKKAAAGAGVGSLLTLALGLIGQGQLAANPAVKALAGFAVGDVIGAGAAFLTGGGLGSISGNSQAAASGGQGFA